MSASAIVISGSFPNLDWAPYCHEQALVMLHGQENRRSFKNEGYEARLDTKFEMVVFGIFAGISFTLTVETNHGLRTAVFLVKPLPVKAAEQTSWDYSPLDQFFPTNAQAAEA